MDRKYGKQVITALDKANLLENLVALGKPCEIKSSIEAIIDECVEATTQIVANNRSASVESYLSELKTRLKDKIYRIPANKGQGDFILSCYTRMHNRYHSIRDVERKESRKDYSERLRYLFFRFATAVSLAAVILATSYIAHNILCIPLPFSSRLSP